ncbi:unnamed protein product [[Candida] boidinii]|nr:unnamed protein product [[Candida] boidinii]
MNINAPTQIAPPQNSSNPISSPQNHLVRSNTTGFSNRVPVLPNNNVGIANSMRNLPHKGPQGVPPSLVQQGTKHANPLADLYAPPPPINGGMTTPRMSPRVWKIHLVLAFSQMMDHSLQQLINNLNLH